MYTLSYMGNTAAVVQGDSYVYDFDSLEEARSAVKEADEINVVFQPANRSRLLELTQAVKQSLKIIPPMSYDVE